ncbi:MAG: hypothetical protein R3C10_06350 [Pirellulales bacterium]
MITVTFDRMNMAIKSAGFEFSIDTDDDASGQENSPLGARWPMLWGHWSG